MSHDVTDKVFKGALILDQKYPEWSSLLEVSTLNFSTILYYLSKLSFEKSLSKLGIDPLESEDFGFYSPERIFILSPKMRMEIDAAWKSEIYKRSTNK